MIIDYITNNQLQIDKATYLVIVIGQITVYGILLTFYQFVASFQGNQNSMTKYLGVNLTEYYVKRKLLIYNKIISKPWFFAFFVVEVLYKPILNIYGKCISENQIHIMNFLWYTYVILYFVMFIILFGQCTKSIFILKELLDYKRNGTTIRNINKEFMTKTLRERLTIKSIELLRNDVKYLKEAIKVDNNPELQNKYNSLIFQIFNLYINNKEKEITKIIEKKKIPKNQVAWIYNAECECTLLDEILKEKYFIINEELKKHICDLHLLLVNINLKRAGVDEYKHINRDFYGIGYFGVEKELLDCSYWKKLTVNIYKNSDIEIRKRLINSLYRGYIGGEDMYQEYCSDCIFYIIHEDICEIFDEKKSQIEFLEIFSDLTKEERINDYCANIIRDNLISYNEFDAVDIVKLLNKGNCTSVFSYIIIYYSIYKYRFDWDYINIKVIKALWDNHGNMQDDTEKVIKTFKESNIEHRFSENMYHKLVEYIRKSLTGSLLDSIYTDNIINMFYVTMVKLCVLDQGYIGYVDEVGADIYINFINELSTHNELMIYDGVKKMVFDIQYNYFMNLEHIPQKLTISLRNLLLTNINLTPDILSDKKSQYIYYNSIGEYALIKLSEKSKDNDIQKELIRKAFITSNMSISDYIDFLNQECHICGCDLNYVQREKMKEHLVSII